MPVRPSSVVMAGHTERAAAVRLPEGQGLATEMAAAAAAVHGTADVRVVTGGAFHSVPAVQQVLADGPTQPRRGGGRISQSPIFLCQGTVVGEGKGMFVSEMGAEPAEQRAAAWPAVERIGDVYRPCPAAEAVDGDGAVVTGQAEFAGARRLAHVGSQRGAVVRGKAGGGHLMVPQR